MFGSFLPEPWFGFDIHQVYSGCGSRHCHAINYNQFNQPQFVLVNNNFELPDLLGAAYEHLIKFFADSAGK
jgi:hypothetical protein